MCYCSFFFNETATTEIYTYGHTLSLHDALPICESGMDACRAGEHPPAGTPLFPKPVHGSGGQHPQSGEDPKKRARRPVTKERFVPETELRAGATPAPGSTGYQ